MSGNVYGPSIIVKARKRHETYQGCCLVCDEPIEKGEHHWFQKGIHDGEPYASREHLRCRKWSEAWMITNVHVEDCPEPGEWKRELLEECARQILCARSDWAAIEKARPFLVPIVTPLSDRYACFRALKWLRIGRMKAKRMEREHNDRASVRKH